MKVAAVLAGYALVLALAGPWLLRRGDWAARAPRLAIAAWQATSAAFVSALVLAGLSLGVPTASLAGGLAQVLRSCAMAIRDAYASPGGAAAAGTGVVLAGGILLRVAWCAGAALLGAARRRAEHVDGLALVGRLDPALGAIVLDTSAAAAYCLPGRARRVVLTTGALAALTDDELAAVLAHEHAHLAGRHHLVLAGAEALASAFPRIPLLATARREVSRLVEMLADDKASTGRPRRNVATALVALAGAATPTGALAAGGPAALARVRRLLAPAAPLGAARTVLATAIVISVLVAPVVAVAAPAAQVAGMRYCPVAMSGPGAVRP